jgi:hypothetical protein
MVPQELHSGAGRTIVMMIVLSSSNKKLLCRPMTQKCIFMEIRAKYCLIVLTNFLNPQFSLKRRKDFDRTFDKLKIIGSALHRVSFVCVSVFLFFVFLFLSSDLLTCVFMHTKKIETFDSNEATSKGVKGLYIVLVFFVCV